MEIKTIGLPQEHYNIRGKTCTSPRHKEEAQDKPVEVSLSPMGRSMALAVRLHEESSEESTIRKEAVEQGRRILSEWQAPSDDKIDMMMSDLACLHYSSSRK